MSKVKKYKPVFHPNANRKLKSLFHRLKSIRGVAREIKVNPRYVYDNLIKGIEPPDTTEKYRIVRCKLFLPSKKKVIRIKSDKPVPKKPDYIVQWDHLPKDERHRVIIKYLEWKNKNEKNSVNSGTDRKS